MSSWNRSQQEFFDEDPRRLATLVFRNPKYPRTIHKKVAFIAEQLADCDRVLEIGAGRGLQLAALLERLRGRGGEYAGIDIALRPLQAARVSLCAAERERVTFVNADAGGLPFADGVFNGAFCIDALHHAASQAAVLAEVCRVLRPGGKVVCVEPNPLFPVNLYYLRDPIERKLFEFTNANVQTWAAQAGLTDAALINLPVFLPGFPRALAGAYERLEDLFARTPLLSRFSTTRVLMARRPTR